MKKLNLLFLLTGALLLAGCASTPARHSQHRQGHRHAASVQETKATPANEKPFNVDPTDRRGSARMEVRNRNQSQ
jgi:PBP1b-binding outer membrane lipoprotein LpoB